MSFTPEEEEEARKLLRYLQSEQQKDNALSAAAASAGKIQKLLAALFGASALLCTGTWRLFEESRRITDAYREIQELRIIADHNRDVNDKQDEKARELEKEIWKLQQKP